MTMHHRHSTCHHLTSPSPTRAVSWSSLAYIFTRNPFLNKLVRKIYGSQISKFTPLPVSLWPTLACVSFREFFEFETSSHVNWINDDSILALHHWKNRSQPQINWGNASAYLGASSVWIGLVFKVKVLILYIYKIEVFIMHILGWW
jgi:hypothetical protein